MHLWLKYSIMEAEKNLFRGELKCRMFQVLTGIS